MRRISEKSKQREKRGEGSGLTYKPYIQGREFNSQGTCSTPVDWKTGRTVELLSQGEKAVWHILRWDDNVIDIREQFPLDLSKTTALAEDLGIRHPKDTKTRMTTDFLVTMKNGTLLAVSVKNDERDLQNKRTTEKLYLEMKYWKNKGVSFAVVLKSKVNMTAVNNIRIVTEFYDANRVFDASSALKHLISQRIIPVDLESEPLDIQKLLGKYEMEVTEWITSHLT